MGKAWQQKPWASGKFLFTLLSRKERKGKEAFSLLSTGDLLGHHLHVHVHVCIHAGWLTAPLACRQECQLALGDQVSGAKTPMGGEQMVRLEAHPSKRNLCLLPETGINVPLPRHCYHDHRMPGPRRPPEVCAQNWRCIELLCVPPDVLSACLSLQPSPQQPASRSVT